MNKIRQYTLVFLCLLYWTKVKTHAQVLKVGDNAPPISAFKWIKGEPVSTLQKGKVHVLEFGATWCKPCIAAIPHISALAEKNGADVNVMSWFVMEFVQKPKDIRNPAYVEKVERFVERQGEKIKYKVAVDDIQRTMETNWLQAADLSGIPNTFIVDKNGYIAWMGTSTRYEVIDEVVDHVLSPDYELAKLVKLSEEAEAARQKFDPNLPFLVNGNGGKDDDYMFRSLMRESKVFYGTPTSPFITSQGWFDRSLPSFHPEIGRVNFVNYTLLDLYYAAYGDTIYYNFIPTARLPGHRQWPDTVANPYGKRLYGIYWFQPVLEVKDPSIFGPVNWRERDFGSADNKYDYSLQVPAERATARYMQEVMQRDLENYFGYQVTVETRQMPCWKLKATRKAKKLLGTKTPGQPFRETFPDDGSYIYKNAVMADIIWSLASKFGIRGFDYRNLPLEEQAPFIDATGLDIEIDYTFSRPHMTDFEAFVGYLESRGLRLEKSTHPMKVVVIRDPKLASSHNLN